MSCWKYPRASRSAAIAGDALAQPVPLHRPGCWSGVQDQARQLIAAPLVIGGLVPGQAGTARGMAVPHEGRPAGRGAVGGLLHGAGCR